MASNADMEEYFNRVICDYNCGDIRKLLSKELHNAGPLLVCIVNGIDLVGGMADGFRRDNSRSRSVNFMRTQMGLSSETADLIYVIVRCGISHEGVPKLCLRFFVDYERVKQGVILYNDVDGSIWLDVVELAHKYLEAIETIGQDVCRHLGHVPTYMATDEGVFADSHQCITDDIQSFCEAKTNARSSKDLGKFERGEIEYMSSTNPFLPDHLHKFEVKNTS